MNSLWGRWQQDNKRYLLCLAVFSQWFARCLYSERDLKPHTVLWTVLVSLLPPRSYKCTHHYWSVCYNVRPLFFCVSLSDAPHSKETDSCYCPRLLLCRSFCTTKKAWRSTPCSPTWAQPFCRLSTHAEVGPNSAKTKHACVYLLPTAAVTNNHTRRGLKEHKRILLRSGRSQIWNGSHWAKIQVLEGMCCFLEALGRPSPAARGPSVRLHCSQPFIRSPLPRTTARKGLRLLISPISRSSSSR